MLIALDRNGLPSGAQLLGRRWDDERLLAIAAQLERLSGGFAPHPATERTGSLTNQALERRTLE